jgi:hypothetical protein
MEILKHIKEEKKKAAAKPVKPKKEKTNVLSKIKKPVN